MATRSRNLLYASMLLTATGCGHGEVSPKAYEYAKALYSITNRQAGETLGPVRAQIEASQSEGELSSSDAAVLIDIVDVAETGDWKVANRDCRDLMEAQVK